MQNENRNRAWDDGAQRLSLAAGGERNNSYGFLESQEKTESNQHIRK